MHSESKILITGTNSGLGKYLKQVNTGALCLTRENSTSVLNSLVDTGVDVIIHCAFNNNKEDLYKFYEDNLRLTENLCNIPHKHFIYISTIDVYSQEMTFYGFTKKVAESIVENKSANFLILRTSAMLGSSMRKNNILKIIDDESPKLSLTFDSTYSLILHSHVADIISKSIFQGLVGKYDVVARDLIKVAAVAKIANKFSCTEYGNFCYLTDNRKGGIIEKILGVKHLTSSEALKEFINERNK